MKKPDMRITGAGEPTLLFVHGYACAHDNWDRQLDALSANFHCIALDLPGHGQSPIPDTVSVGVLAEAVSSVKERVGGNKVVLVGHSMGCRVVAEAYRQSPDKVVGLVFVDGSRFTGDPDVAITLTRDAANGGDPNTQPQPARAPSLRRKFRDDLALRVLHWDLEEAETAVKQIAVPVLVLQSTNIGDDLERTPLQLGMTTPWMDLIAALVPQSEAKIITGSGHFIMIDAPQALNDEVAKFAAKLG